MAIAIAYGPLCGSTSEFFRLDDGDYVVNNEHVQAGLTWKSIGWAFTTFEASNWHPLTWLSLQLDYEWYGLSPGGYHLTNVILHALNAVLLLIVLSQLTGPFWPSAFVAALFALHPLRVESVAWIAERKDVLSTFFWIVTIGLYGWYVKRPSVLRYLAVVAAFVLGLLAKPMLVTLPCTLLLLDYWPLRRFSFGQQADSAGTMPKMALASEATAKPKQASLTWLIVEKLPLFVLSLGACIVTVLAQGVAKETVFVNLPWSLRVSNALHAYLGYLEKTLWPSHLVPIYTQPLDHFSLAQGIVGGIVVLLLTILCLTFIRYRQYLAVGWFWFLGTLVPVIGLVQVGIQTMADRYTYVPHMGLFIMIVWSLRDLLAGRFSRPVLACGAGVILVGCLITTILQARLWQDSLALWEHAVAVTDNNFAAYDNLGVSLIAKGRTAEAMPYFRTAIQIEPRFAMGHYHLGLALDEQQKWSEAAGCFAEALRLVPRMTQAMEELGLCYLKLEMMEEALAPIEMLAHAKPDSAEVHGNYCLVLLYLGRLAEAEREGKEALRLNPQIHEPKKLLGYVFALQGKLAEAEQLFRTAQVLEGPPRRLDAAASYYLAWSLEAQGKADAARAQYQYATQRFPRWSQKTREEAWRLSTDPDPKRRNGPLAVLRAQVANLATGDTDVSSLDTLAAAYAEAGKYPEAVATERKALSLVTGAITKEQADAMNQRLRLYEQGQSYRQTTSPGK